MAERSKCIAASALGKVYAFDLLTEVIPELLNIQIKNLCICLETMDLQVEDGD